MTSAKFSYLFTPSPTLVMKRIHAPSFCLLFEDSSPQCCFDAIDLLIARLHGKFVWLCVSREEDLKLGGNMFLIFIRHQSESGHWLTWVPHNPIHSFERVLWHVLELVCGHRPRIITVRVTPQNKTWQGARLFQDFNIWGCVLLTSMPRLTFLDTCICWFPFDQKNRKYMKISYFQEGGYQTSGMASEHSSTGRNLGWYSF